MKEERKSEEACLRERGGELRVEAEIRQRGVVI